MDELKQLTKEWEIEADRHMSAKDMRAITMATCSIVYKTCADQLKTITEAHESKLPNLNIDIGEELPDLKQAE